MEDQVDGLCHTYWGDGNALFSRVEDAGGLSGSFNGGGTFMQSVVACSHPWLSRRAKNVLISK